VRTERYFRRHGAPSRGSHLQQRQCAHRLVQAEAFFDAGALALIGRVAGARSDSARHGGLADLAALAYRRLSPELDRARLQVFDERQAS
jgi:hypothetical protein